jgi:protein-S-isoprenylcysteine O-methyltransferase Ste14
MKQPSKINYFFVMIAFTLGVSLTLQFDFSTYRFKQPSYATILYVIVFVIALVLAFKGLVSKPKEK